MRVGFAGLGRMGWPMAANLVTAGLDVTVWNRSTEKALAFAEHTGAGYVTSPSELTSQCDVVITMLADDRASEAVHLADDGLFAALTDAEDTDQASNRCTFIEMGTISLDHFTDLRQSAKGHKVIDAPVSGATQAATDGKLLIMAGATAEEVAEIAAVLEPLSRDVIPLSTAGSGCVMKLSVNMLIHGINQCLAESMALAESVGITPEQAFGVIENSAAAAPSIGYRKNLYLDESNHPVSFTVALAKKDMGLALDLAQQFGVNMPQSTATHAELVNASDKGYAERDMAAMVQYIKER